VFFSFEHGDAAMLHPIHPLMRACVLLVVLGMVAAAQAKPADRAKTVDGSQRLRGEAPTVIFVDADAPPDGDGTSWAAAYDDLFVAIEAADEGDQLWIAEGRYLNLTGASSVEITKALELYGGFAGDEQTLDERDFEAHFTIVDGTPSPDVESGANSLYLFEIVGIHEYLIFDGLYFVNHRRPIAAYDATVMIRHCTFQTMGVLNHIYAIDSTFTISTSTLQNHQVHVSRSECGFIDCSFKDINDDSLRLSSSDVYISGCTFDLAGSDGSAVNADGCEVDVHHSTFTGDNTLFENNAGQGVDLSRCNAYISSCTFENLTSDREGVAINTNNWSSCEDSFVLWNTTVRNCHSNAAPLYGSTYGAGCVNIKGFRDVQVGYCTFEDNTNGANLRTSSTCPRMGVHCRRMPVIHCAYSIVTSSIMKPVTMPVHLRQRLITCSTSMTVAFSGTPLDSVAAAHSMLRLAPLARQRFRAASSIRTRAFSVAALSIHPAVPRHMV
jgi:hypothetical protein